MKDDPYRVEGQRFICKEAKAAYAAILRELERRMKHSKFIRNRYRKAMAKEGARRRSLKEWVRDLKDSARDELGGRAAQWLRSKKGAA